MRCSNPLLDRVRQCSAAPDQAASFFLQIFHPVPHERVKVTDHAWFASTVMSMRDAFDRAAQALAADKARMKKFSSLRQRGSCVAAAQAQLWKQTAMTIHLPRLKSTAASGGRFFGRPSVGIRGLGMWQHTLMHQSIPRMVLCRLTACTHSFSRRHFWRVKAGGSAGH